uniref:hypothetical protein n=1 Tax=Cellulomonas endophytica TaxID=2494735 RepID=UPI00196A9BB1
GDARPGAPADDVPGRPGGRGEGRTVRPARRSGAPGSDAAGAGAEDEPVPPGGPSAPGGPRATGATGRDWDATSQYDEAEARVDAQESFVPPDPGPVLGGDPLRTAAWTAVVVCPLVVLVALVVGPSVPRTLVQASGIVLLLAVAVLVWRMPHRRDPDDRDDGAVV